MRSPLFSGDGRGFESIDVIFHVRKEMVQSPDNALEVEQKVGALDQNPQIINIINIPMRSISRRLELTFSYGMRLKASSASGKVSRCTVPGSQVMTHDPKHTISTLIQRNGQQAEVETSLANSLQRRYTWSPTIGISVYL